MKKARLKLAPLDPKGIPIGEILVVHQQFQPKYSIADNIGDGFLLKNNPIYRKIRENFLARGFSFTPSGLHYYTFPLMSLDVIYAQKSVPFRNNVFWLKELEKIPNFTLTELKKCELRFNYLLHECAHFIAHKELFGDQEMNQLPVTKDSLLRILIGESYANSVETMAAIYAEGEIEHYFLDANCHYRLDAKEVRAIKKLVSEHGSQKTFLLILASFLQANYLVHKPNASEIRSMAKFSGIKKIPKTPIGFGLSEIFRTNTTQLHLMKLGFPADLNGWLECDPVAELLKPKSKELRDRVADLAAISI